MGAVEEGGKAVGGIIESLKGQPFLLAMIITNFALIGFMYYAQMQFFRERATFLESEKQVREILSKCIVPPKAAWDQLKPTVDDHEDNR